MLQRVARSCRRAARLLASLVEILIFASARSWLRHPLVIVPAVLSTTLLLLAVGSAAIGFTSARAVVDQQARSVAFVRFYLRDDASDQGVADLEARLRADRRVRSVQHVTKADALARASREPGLAAIAQQAGRNPFPASLDAQLLRLDDLPAVAVEYSADPAVDPGSPTSYDPASYRRLEQILYVAAWALAVVLALLGAMAVTLLASAIRTSTVARADEIAVMRLVGASPAIIRASFLAEGGLTGATAGLTAAIVLLASCALAARIAGPYLPAVAPGVDATVVLADAALLPVAGAALAGVAGVLALKGLLR